MHSSISLSLEPGLERGVPWGRDLYTFVSSAAGHMMRTLEKPRKNRPLKRQVNHRRFLHNMIQRKFADIEAANHRLASVLYLKGDEKTRDTPDPSLNPSQINPSVENSTSDGEVLEKSKGCITVDSQNPEIGRKTQPESTRKPRSKSRKSKHQKSEQKRLDFTSMERMSSETMHFYGDEIEADALLTRDAQAQSSHHQFDLDISPSFSPELSPLSLDSCDFAVQMFTDVSSCTPVYSDSVEEIVESQWTELFDLFNAGSNNRIDSTDVEDLLESICDCHSDAEYSKDDEQEDVFYERVQCRYNTCQVEAANQLEHIVPLFTSDNALDVNNFTSSNSDIIQSEQPDCMNYQCTSYQHDPQQRQYELNPVLFEGVAQAFSAPSQNVPRFSIPTPPYEGEWLFTDILTDNTMSLC